MAGAWTKLLCVTFFVSNALAYNLCKHKENGVRIAHPLDCRHFIVCEQGNTGSIGTCPDGLHFNSKLGECDLTTRAGCAGLNFWAAENSCDTSSCCACCDCSGCPTCDNDLPVCQGQPDNSLQQYPGDCSKYVVCENNCAIIKECPCGELWNNITQRCDTACNVDCPGSGYPCPTCSNNLTVCRDQADNSIQQYPDDCSKYVVCQNNCATINTCPSGQLWNPETQCCDKDCNVDCPGSGFPCPTCSNNLTVCAGRPDNTFLQYPDDCSKYIECQGNCATIKACIENELWNTITERCETACNVDCPGSGYPCPTCSNNLTVCAGKPNGSYQSYPNNCTQYVLCENNCGTVRECPYEQLWNNATNQCEDACEVDCANNPYVCDRGCPEGLEICAGQPAGSIQSYPDDCSVYVICNDECIPDIFNCSNGQLFNPNTKECDRACNVNCPGSGFPCRPQTGPSGESCDTPGVCRDMPDGTLFIDANSRGYIVCQCECEILRPCPAGLIFNENLSTCDWPPQIDGSSVNCPPGLVYSSALGACNWP